MAKTIKLQKRLLKLSLVSIFLWVGTQTEKVEAHQVPQRRQVSRQRPPKKLLLKLKSANPDDQSEDVVIYLRKHDNNGDPILQPNCELKIGTKVEPFDPQDEEKTKWTESEIRNILANQQTFVVRWINQAPVKQNNCPIWGRVLTENLELDNSIEIISNITGSADNNTENGDAGDGNQESNSSKGKDSSYGSTLPKDKDTTQHQYSSMEPLAWESQKNPERKKWSKSAYQTIESVFSTLDSAKDAYRFCPNYDNLNHSEKVNFWGQFFAGLAYFESGWKPTSRRQESELGQDSLTRLPVFSEGLLQLSYQDTKWASYCKFDWSTDRHLSPRDPSKTILSPYLNLDCGIRIMARQIKKTHALVLSRGVYWATLKSGGRYPRMDGIARYTKKLSFCN